MLSRGSPVPEGCQDRAHTVLVSAGSALHAWQVVRTSGQRHHLLSASQSGYRIDPNQELLALGKRLLDQEGRGGAPAPALPGVPQPLSCLKPPPRQSCLRLKFSLPHLACCCRPRLTAQEFPEQAESLLHGWMGTAWPRGPGREKVMMGTQTQQCLPSPSPSSPQASPMSWAPSSPRIPSRAALAGG